MQHGTFWLISKHKLDQIYELHCHLKLWILLQGKQNIYLLPKISKFSFITILRAFTSTSIGRFPSVVCLCDLERGLNQLSDLMALQLGFWLQEQRGGGDSCISHGVLVYVVRGVHQGLSLFSHFCFPKTFPAEDTELLWQLYRELYQCVCSFCAAFFSYSKTL